MVYLKKERKREREERLFFMPYYLTRSDKSEKGVGGIWGREDQEVKNKKKIKRKRKGKGKKKRMENRFPLSRKHRK